MLPKGAVIVNVGRGMIIEEDALFDLLRTGHIGGAGLDVWFNYPMYPGAPRDSLLPANR